MRLALRQCFSSFFHKVQMAPPDPILGINQAFAADADPRKVNLGVGAYRDDSGRPYVFNVVRKVEQGIVADTSLNKEYIPIDGLPGFNLAARNLIIGAENEASKAGRIITVQGLSGTGSLRVGFEFLAQEAPSKVLVSDPTWANHHNVIRRSSLIFEKYPYYDPATKSIQFAKLKDLLNAAAPGTIVLMHACAHNPTGVDFSREQWECISGIMKEKSLFPFFDSAYQGFASGDLINDAWAIRKFINDGHEMLLAQSFAKNMGLYGERVGALHLVTRDKDSAQKGLSQLKQIIRANYSSPPTHGARIAEKVLSDANNLQAWKTELKAVAQRIISMRGALRTAIEDLKTPGTWNHITDQIGMFSYTGLTEPQVQVLIQKYHIYLVTNGRISMAGINSNNVNYVA